MTEVRVDVELEHPPERVWRALTDRHLLPKWFAESDLEPRAGSVFSLDPINVPGLDGPVEGELISLDEPRRLSMRWRADELPTLVTWELTATPAGCRLSHRESCVREQWESEQRARLEESYRQLFTVRLPAVLDWLAFREVDFAATVPAAAARARRRRGGLLAGAVAVLLAALAMVAVMGLPKPEPDEQATAAPERTPVEPTAVSPPPPGASPAPTARAAAATVTRSPSTAIRPSSPRPAPPTRPSADADVVATARLGARYATVGSRLFGYDGEITVSNTGNVPAAGWVVTVTLPPGSSTVAAASGASHEQEGRTVRFTGGPLAAGSTASVRFEVRGAPAGEKEPAGCVLGAQPCAGL